MLQETSTDSFKKRLPATFKSHGTWYLFQCCFYVIFFLIQWPTVSEWGQVSVRYIIFLSLFLQEAPCSCVSVCDCTHVLPQFSGVAVVSSPLSLNLVNQPGTPRTWRCNRCDSHDHLFDWYRQNKYASLVLNLIFLLLLKILHWWLLLIRWLQVNILFFLNRKKEHNKILLYKKKKLQVILSLFVHYIV